VTFQSRRPWYCTSTSEVGCDATVDPVKTGVVALRLSAKRTAPTVVSVQARAVDLDEGAAVKLVGAVGGSNLNLAAGVTSFFRVVVIGDYFDFLY
jgi:hypothetical protein